jgi:antitoxin MazE
MRPDEGREDVRVTIRRWGNSLAVRIPKSFAAETRLEQDAEVELSIEEGKLVISPAAPRRPTLVELLYEVTPENLHGEFGTGPAFGAEVW